MSDEKRRYKAVIAGRTYTIVGKKSTEHLETVSQITNDTIRQLMSAQPNLDIEQRAILVAVNTISENIVKQMEIESLKETNADLEKRVEQLRKRIQTLQNQTKRDNPQQLIVQDQIEELKPSPEKQTTNRPKTKLVRPTPKASQADSQQRGRQEVSQPFTGKIDLPAASKKKLENKGAYKNSPLGNR